MTAIVFNWPENLKAFVKILRGHIQYARGVYACFCNIKVLINRPISDMNNLCISDKLEINSCYISVMYYNMFWVAYSRGKIFGIMGNEDKSVIYYPFILLLVLLLQSFYNRYKFEPKTFILSCMYRLLCKRKLR